MALSTEPNIAHSQEVLDYSPLPSFIAITVLVILAPGADVILLIRAALMNSKRAAFAAFAGIHLGNIITTTVVASGLGAAIAHSHNLMRAITWVGGLYLLWLAYGAVQAVWNARHLTSQPDDVDQSVETAKTLFRRGLLTNITNPKILIFYVSFLPQFMGHAHNAFAQLELLAAVFIAIAMIWEGCVVLLAARCAHLMANPRFSLTLDALCAVAFASLGVAVLLI